MLNIPRSTVVTKVAGLGIGFHYYIGVLKASEEKEKTTFRRRVTQNLFSNKW